MSEMLEGDVPTGHRVFRGKKRIESEWMPTEMKPFVVRQPGDEDDATDDEKKAKAAAPAQSEAPKKRTRKRAAKPAEEPKAETTETGANE